MYEPGTQAHHSPLASFSLAFLPPIFSDPFWAQQSFSGYLVSDPNWHYTRPPIYSPCIENKNTTKQDCTRTVDVVVPRQVGLLWLGDHIHGAYPWVACLSTFHRKLLEGDNLRLHHLHRWVSFYRQFSSKNDIMKHLIVHTCSSLSVESYRDVPWSLTKFSRYYQLMVDLRSCCPYERWASYTVLSHCIMDNEQDHRL